MADLVTVVMPARNAAATLPACLASIARQSLAAFRCLVVDDGSGDGTAAVVRRFAAADARFELAPNPGRGLVAALQHGCGRCGTPWLARMDADDVMHRDRLRLQVAALSAAPELAGVGCHARPFPAAAFGSGLRSYCDWLRTIRTADDVARDAFVECPLLHPTWMVRTEVLRAHGYRDVDWPEDYDLLLRLLQAGCRLGVVPRTLHAWRRGRAAATVTDRRYAAAAFPRLKAAFLASGFLRGHAHYVLWGHGDTGRALRRELLRTGRHVAAVVELHPRKLGQHIDGAPVVPPDRVPGLAPLPIVVSVAGTAARALVRTRLQALGKRELVDFVCAA